MNRDYKIVFVDKMLPISEYEKEIIEEFGCTVSQYDAIAVSYTHLDVYKRQSECSVVRR